MPLQIFQRVVDILKEKLTRDEWLIFQLALDNDVDDDFFHDHVSPVVIALAPEFFLPADAKPYKSKKDQVSNEDLSDLGQRSREHAAPSKAR